MKTAFDTLLRLDENGNLQANLSTEWKFASDNKSITLSLRKGVKFHDGADFNAAAVKWNMELRKASKFGDLDSLTSIDVVDDNTVRLNLSEFQNTTLVALWHIGGMMQSPTSYQRSGG